MLKVAFYSLFAQSMEQQYSWRYDCALAAARVAVSTDPNLYPEQVFVVLSS